MLNWPGLAELDSRSCHHFSLCLDNLIFVIIQGFYLKVTTCLRTLLSNVFETSSFTLIKAAFIQYDPKYSEKSNIVKYYNLKLLNIFLHAMYYSNGKPKF